MHQTNFSYSRQTYVKPPTKHHRARPAARSSFVPGRFVYGDDRLPSGGSSGGEDAVENDYCKVDAVLDWDKIVSVVLFSESQTCPVCLDDPAVAAWVLPSCGHVVCGACRQQLLQRGIDKCSVCSGSFLHLRPATFDLEAHPCLSIGASIELRLVARRRDLGVVLPMEEFLRRSDLGISFERLPLAESEAAKFTRFTVGHEEIGIEAELEAINVHLAVIQNDVLEQEGFAYWVEAREDCLVCVFPV